MKYYWRYDTPVGVVTVGVSDTAVTTLHFGAHTGDLEMETPLSALVAQQLAEYFAGTRKTFDLPISYAGPPFYQAVWDALLKVPYGETRSYQGVSWMAGNLRGARAVGMAVHNNPISIIIPCHRVIYADGSLGGFGGVSLDVKRALLELEGVAVK